MKKRQLSIIIPCYNVEDYIVSCLESIKKQINNIEYEIILIDDSSIDNSVNVIKDYMKNNKMNIKFLINEQNYGAGYSRNKAIKEAKYKYISFIDADDYLEDNFYDEMFNNVEQKDLDVIVCDINLVYDDGRPNDIGFGCVGKINRINMINTGFAASPCNKIIKKELLLEYPFAEGIMNEDVASIIAILVNAKKISYTNKTSYNYVQHFSSIQNSKLSLKRFDIFKAISILKERIKDNENYDEIMEAVSFQQLFLFFIYVLPREKNFFKRIKFLRLFRKEAKEYNISQNNLCKENLKIRGKKADFYYNLIFNLNEKGFSITSSLIMSVFNIYHNIKHSKFITRNMSVIKNNITMKDLIKYAKKQKKMANPNKKISVVIPNYNYERFLLQRLYSILYQNYKIYEIIILDDCSSDNSIALIDNIEKELNNYISIRKDYNEKNSGTAFKQWQRGLKMAKGDYIWIAEADDYCENCMLSSLMNFIEKDDKIVLGYVDTAFIDVNGVKKLKSIVPEIDIQKTGHWNETYINNGINEIKNYSYLNCTIANVSSCIIKKGNYDKYLVESSEYKQAGDWLFYINVVKNGKILFVNKPINYYRVHGNNVSSTMKKERHIEEINKIHSFVKKEFDLTKEHEEKMQKRIEFLEKVWGLNKK